MIDTTIIKKVLDDVNRAMIYESDEVVFRKEEYWRSWKQEVLDGKTRIKDDCDGFALTIAELLYHYGLPKENIALAFCEIIGHGYHLATKVYNRDDKKWYMLDCNVTVPRPVDEISDYRWESVMYLSDPRNWVRDE